MPPRWPRKPDRANDPAYRKLEDRINFAVHVALYAAVNSGMWFFNTLDPGSIAFAKPVSLFWAAILVGHATYIFAITDYSPTSSPNSKTG